MQYNRYYKNSLVIVDLAMGQMPHSTKHVCSFPGILNEPWIKKFVCCTSYLHVPSNVFYFID